MGVGLAIAVELAHWVSVRWDFHQAAFVRAWNLSLLLVIARVALTLFESSSLQVVPELMQWLPLLFFPLQFTQSYGLKDRMPLHTFSALARKRWQRNQELGIGGEPQSINFGSIYLIFVVLSATAGDPEKQASPWLYLTGVVILTAWALYGLQPGRKVALMVSLVVAGLLSVGGMFGMQAAYRWATQGRFDSGGGRSYNEEIETAIGALGEIKQSNKIAWRMKVKQGPAPRLLRTSIYNQYDRGVWKIRLIGDNAAKDANFTPLPNQEPVPGEVYYFTANEGSPEDRAGHLPRISLRGEAWIKMSLPLPDNAVSLTGFELDNIERNSLATVRIEPKDAIIAGDVLSRPGASPDAPPRGDVSDIRIPPEEIEAVREVSARLALKDLPLEDKLQAIRNLFLSEYRYTRYLSIPRISTNDPRAKTAMSRFLTTTHEGHCEYFATAATFLLREAGVPARYAVGYSVQELDPSKREFVMRGTHFHAWCRVWDKERKIWRDFDPTPPNWLTKEPIRRPWNQGMTDWVQRVREDFFLWRNEPKNAIIVAVTVGTFGLLGAAAIGRGLWKSRRRIERDQGSDAPNLHGRRTPLHDLEGLARKILGPRPLGTPYGRWLLGLEHRFPSNRTVSEAVAIHQRLRFDPAPPSEADTQRLSELEREVRGHLRSLPESERKD